MKSLKSKLYSGPNLIFSLTVCRYCPHDIEYTVNLRKLDEIIDTPIKIEECVIKTNET